MKRYTVDRAPRPRWACRQGLVVAWAVYLDGRVIQDGFDTRAQAREWAKKRNEES